MRERVGLSEISNFAKYRVTGEGAEAWLDRMLACKLPRAGRMTLAPMLKEDGKLIGDFSLANLGGAASSSPPPLPLPSRGRGTSAPPHQNPPPP